MWPTYVKIVVVARRSSEGIASLAVSSILIGRTHRILAFRFARCVKAPVSCAEEVLIASQCGSSHASQPYSSLSR